MSLISGLEMSAATKEENAARKSAIIAVWGPAGSPGRSMLSAALSWCLADFESTRLVDADTYAPSQAICLGVDAESTPGLAFCLRSISAGEKLNQLIPELDVSPYRERELKLHTGMLRTEIWDELDSTQTPTALAGYRDAGRVTVFDLSANFDSPDSSKDQIAAAIVENADTVIAICDANELGVLRFIRGMSRLREQHPEQNFTVVLNRARKGMDRKSHSRIAQLLEKYGDIKIDHYLPLSHGVCDAAAEFAEPVTKVDSSSAISQEIEVLAKRILLKTIGSI